MLTARTSTIDQSIARTLAHKHILEERVAKRNPVSYYSKAGARSIDIRREEAILEKLILLRGKQYVA